MLITNGHATGLPAPMQKQIQTSAANVCICMHIHLKLLKPFKQIHNERSPLLYEGLGRKDPYVQASHRMLAHAYNE